MGILYFELLVSNWHPKKYYKTKVEVKKYILPNDLYSITYFI